VDADAFLKLVLREVVLGSYMEDLAQEIHKEYCKNYPGAPNAIPWKDLTEHMRGSNRDQAREFSKYLSMVGCSYDAGDTPFPSIDKFKPGEIDIMAQHAHIIWMAGKKADGWVWGPENDRVKKTNPCLVDWKDLPKEEKEKDKDIARNIIKQLEAVGLRVYRMV